MNLVKDLNYLENLPAENLAKKQNIISLVVAFDKYFSEVSNGTLWEGYSPQVHQCINNIEKWKGKNAKSIIRIIENVKSAIIEPDGSIPEYFLLKDNISHSASINEPNLNELCVFGQGEKVGKLINPILPTNKPQGTATKYICLFNRIQNYYKLSK